MEARLDAEHSLRTAELHSQTHKQTWGTTKACIDLRDWIDGGGEHVTDLHLVQAFCVRAPQLRQGGSLSLHVRALRVDHSLHLADLAPTTPKVRIPQYAVTHAALETRIYRMALTLSHEHVIITNYAICKTELLHK